MLGAADTEAHEGGAALAAAVGANTSATGLSSGTTAEAPEAAGPQSADSSAAPVAAGSSSAQAAGPAMAEGSVPPQRADTPEAGNSSGSPCLQDDLEA